MSPLTNLVPVTKICLKIKNRYFCETKLQCQLCFIQRVDLEMKILQGYNRSLLTVPTEQNISALKKNKIHKWTLVFATFQEVIWTYNKVLRRFLCHFAAVGLSGLNTLDLRSASGKTGLQLFILIRYCFNIRQYQGIIFQLRGTWVLPCDHFMPVIYFCFI